MANIFRISVIVEIKSRKTAKVVEFAGSITTCVIHIDLKKCQGTIDIVGK